MIKIFIAVDPVAKARPRFTRFGRAYTPAKTARFEKFIRLKFKELLKDAPILTEALSVSLRFFLKRPKSVKRPYPSVRSDLDNYTKSVLDSLNNVAYVDDAQIINLTLSKEYSEIAGIEIKIDVIK